MPTDLQKLLLFHANKDVTDRYAEQLKEDVEWRKQDVERAGLGFELPIREFQLATWASKAAIFEIEESRLTD